MFFARFFYSIKGTTMSSNLLSVFVNVFESFGSPYTLGWIGRIIKALIEGCSSIGVGIILFTLILKAVTLPFDIYSRISTKKNALKMEKMRPELEKLQSSALQPESAGDL